MKLLYLSLSAASLGEAYIGLSLADQLRDEGFDHHFVIPPATEWAVRQFGFPYTTLDYKSCPKGEQGRDFLRSLVAGIAPDAIILADFNSYERNIKIHFETDPWCIEELGIPILPIDLAEYEKTDLQIDLCGRKPLPVGSKILDLPAHLRPVPNAHVDPGPGGRGFPYRVVREEQPADPAECAEVRARFGVGSHEKLVLMPISTWQVPGGGKLGSDMIRRLSERVADLLAHYLGRLPASTHFLLIGRPGPAFDRLPAERVHVVPSLPLDEFKTAICASDLLALLSPSTTGGRAVLMDKPVVVLQNRFTVGDADDLERLDRRIGLTDTVRDWLKETLPIEPFRLCPKGSYRIFEPMFTDNDLLSALVVAELLDETAVVTAMESLLFDRATGDRLAAARARYITSLAGLPKTADVVRAAIDRCRTS
jgi:hypothetical protein